MPRSLGGRHTPRHAARTGRDLLIDWCGGATRNNRRATQPRRDAQRSTWRTVAQACHVADARHHPFRREVRPHGRVRHATPDMSPSRFMRLIEPFTSYASSRVMLHRTYVASDGGHGDPTARRRVCDGHQLGPLHLLPPPARSHTGSYGGVDPRSGGYQARRGEAREGGRKGY
jgi:hypothetical protein